MRLGGLCSQLTAGAALDLRLACIRLPRGVPAPPTLRSQLQHIAADRPVCSVFFLPLFLFPHSFFLSFSSYFPTSFSRPSLSPLLLTSFIFLAPSPHSNPQTLQKGWTSRFKDGTSSLVRGIGSPCQDCRLEPRPLALPLRRQFKGKGFQLLPRD